MHQVVEDAGALQIGDFNLAEEGFLTEWRMQIGFCFEHNGFRLDPRVDPWDDTTWEYLVCPHCADTETSECFILGGTLDGLEPVWRDFDRDTGTLPAILWDLKTMQEYAVSFFIKGDAKNTYHRHVKDEHFLQAQIYKYLAERSPPPETLANKGVKQLRLVESNIQAFSMGEFPRTGSTYLWTDHWSKAKSPWDIPSVEFMEDPWIESEIRTRAYPVYKTLILQAERPGICPPNSKRPEEHSWECRFCAFEGSKYCPSPSEEWAALQSGKSPDEAFNLAKEKRKNQ